MNNENFDSWSTGIACSLTPQDFDLKEGVAEFWDLHGTPDKKEDLALIVLPNDMIVDVGWIFLVNKFLVQVPFSETDWNYFPFQKLTRDPAELKKYVQEAIDFAASYSKK